MQEESKKARRVIRRAFVVPSGFEPESQASEAHILSIVLWDHLNEFKWVCKGTFNEMNKKAVKGGFNRGGIKVNDC